LFDDILVRVVDNEAKKTYEMIGFCFMGSPGYVFFFKKIVSEIDITHSTSK